MVSWAGPIRPLLRSQLLRRLRRAVVLRMAALRQAQRPVRVVMARRAARAATIRASKAALRQAQRPLRGMR